MPRSRSKGRFKLTTTDLAILAGGAAVGAVALLAGAHASPVSPPPSPSGSVSRITINSNFSSIAEGGQVQIFGIALNAFSSGVSGATLFLIVNGNEMDQTVSGSGGAYQFNEIFSVPPGMYQIHISTEA